MAADLKSAEDEVLACQTNAGSMAAFEELVCRYEHRIFGFVLHSGSREMDAREITQDTFVRAFQSIAQFKPERSFAAWLFTIARRKCIDRYRAVPRWEGGEPLPEPQDVDDPSELLARQEDRQELWRKAREVLSHGQYQALWLRYVEDFTGAEIAQVLGKTEMHIKVLLFRARRTLAAAIAKNGKGCKQVRRDSKEILPPNKGIENRIPQMP